jgi:hypothetical protein
MPELIGVTFKREEVIIRDQQISGSELTMRVRSMKQCPSLAMATLELARRLRMLVLK